MSMINLSGRLKNRFFVCEVILKRKEQILSITASITPASNADLMKQPEGDRFAPVINIFSETPLEINDVVVFNDKNYVINHLEDWSSNGYYYGQATRLVPTDNRNSTGFSVT